METSRKCALQAAAITLFCVCFLTPGTAGKSYDYADPSFVFPPEELVAALLEDTSLVLIDARGKSAHARGHIPGAIASDWQEYTDMSGSTKNPGYGVALPAEQLAEKLGARGIHPSRTIVVYGDPVEGWGEDGHLVWLLRMVGISKASVLDGGIYYWSREGYSTTRQKTKPRATSFTIGSLDSSWVTTTSALHEKLSGLQIIDTRAPKEFKGAKPYGEARGGHVPGAVNLHFKEVYQSNGRLKPQAELLALLSAHSLSADKPTVAYCTGGVRSGVVAVLLRMVGYAQACNYDGSFWEWAADKGLPLE